METGPATERNLDVMLHAAVKFWDMGYCRRMRGVRVSGLHAQRAGGRRGGSVLEVNTVVLVVHKNKCKNINCFKYSPSPYSPPRV